MEIAVRKHRKVIDFGSAELASEYGGGGGGIARYKYITGPGTAEWTDNLQEVYSWISQEKKELGR